MVRDTLLNYPDFNEGFKIQTNSSEFQLGTVIIEKGKTISIYSRKLTDDQKYYTVTERAILIIFRSLKEFSTILLGERLIIYTDNKNITYKKFNMNRVLIWRIILNNMVQI